MKLLFITQKVDLNDDILGFVHTWIEKLAQKLDKLYVICLEKGKYNLPENVEVYSLGKGGKKWLNCYIVKWLNGCMVKLLYCWRFYRYIWRERRNYDGVFVHMNPEYIVLGGLFWRLWKKKIVLWYTHKAVNLKLKLAERLVNKILTASPESCRLKSKKIKVLGHGIDVEKFEMMDNVIPRSPAPFLKGAGRRKIPFDISNQTELKVLSVGRISPIKNLETLIKAIHVLVTDYRLPVTCLIVGQPLLEKDKIYFQKLKDLIKEKKLEEQIKFLGSIPYQEIPKYYQEANLLVSTSLTGSVDKVPLEAMLYGLLVLTCNEAFGSILEKYKDQLMFAKQNPKDLAEKILAVSQLENEEIRQLRRCLKEEVIKNHSLDRLIKKIIKFYV